MSMKPLIIHSPSFVATAFANETACACRRFKKVSAVTTATILNQAKRGNAKWGSEEKVGSMKGSRKRSGRGQRNRLRWGNGVAGGGRRSEDSPTPSPLRKHSRAGGVAAERRSKKG